MKYLFFFFILSFLMSCKSTVDEKGEQISNELTEDDIYEIINEGYYSYLDSIEREAKIHFGAIVLEDTNFCDKFISNLDIDPAKEHFYLKKATTHIHPTQNYFDFKNLWKEKLLINVSIVTTKKIDSIRTIFTEDFMARDIYCVSVPYRPIGSERVVIMENVYKEFDISCYPPENTYLFFRKVNGNWKFEKRF